MEIPFKVGDVVRVGKYKNRLARVIRFSENDKGQMTVVVEPIPKGRKKTKEMGLFKIWTTPDKVEAVAAIKFTGKVPSFERVLFAAFVKYMLGDTAAVALKPKKKLGKRFGYVRADALERGVYTVAFESGGTLAALGAIAHELTHIDQYIRGDLRFDGDAFVWKGKPAITDTEYNKLSYADYARLPWEQEALQNQKTKGRAFLQERLHTLRGQDPTLDVLIKHDMLAKVVAKGRKKTKEMGLFKIWTTPDAVEAVAAATSFDQVLSPATVKKLRADFLTLMKNIKRIKNYKQAFEWHEAVQRWGRRLESYMESAVNELGRFRRDELDPKTIAAWQDRLRGVLWPLITELWSTGFDRYELATRYTYLPHDRADVERQLYRDFIEKAPKYDRKVKRVAREAWKDFDAFLQVMQATWEQKGMKGLPLPQTEQIKLEGFSVTLKNLSERAYVTPRKAVAVLKAGLALYRKQAAKVYPWLVRHQLPIVLDGTTQLDKGGVYNPYEKTIDIAVGTERPGRVAHVIAHEMGHFIWREILSAKDHEFWDLAIKGSRGPFDLRDILEAKDEFAGRSAELERDRPLFALQIRTLIHDPRFARLDLSTKSGVAQYLAKGNDPVIQVTVEPITGYASKNPEEAFCEALGLLVAYGPRTVLPVVRQRISMLLPQMNVQASVADTRLRLPEKGVIQEAMLARSQEIARAELDRGIETVAAFRKTVYHGTDAVFDKFDPKKQGSATDEGLLGAGFYFSTDPAIARTHKYRLSVQVQLRNPLNVQAASWSDAANKAKLVSDAIGLAQTKTGTALTKAVQAAGHDGVILDMSPVGYRHQEIVAYDAKAVKILSRETVACVTAAAVKPPLKELSRSKKRFKGPNGNELAGYQWVSKIDDVYDKYEGGLVAKRVSDWDRAVPCASCRRNIVHIYWVVNHQTGKVEPYGGDHLHIALGYPRELGKSEVERMRKRVLDLAAEQKQESQKAEYYRKAYTKLINLRAVSLDSPKPLREANHKWLKTKLPEPSGQSYEHVWLVDRKQRLLMRADGNYTDLWDQYAPGKWERLSNDMIGKQVQELIGAAVTAGRDTWYHGTSTESGLEKGDWLDPDYGSFESTVKKLFQKAAKDEPELYHTTSLKGLAAILKGRTFKPAGLDGFVSFGERPLFGDIRGNDAVLVLDRTKLRSRVMPVEYTEPWYERYPEHAAYVAGEGWREQYQEPEDCYDDEGWADEECVERAYRDAELDAFLDKRGEREWVGRAGGDLRLPADAFKRVVVPQAKLEVVEALLKKLGLRMPVTVLRGRAEAAGTSDIEQQLKALSRLDIDYDYDPDRQLLEFEWGTPSDPDRPTHRRRNAKLPRGNVLQFAENPDRNRHYGPHRWTLAERLPYVVDDERVIEIAMDEFEIERDEAIDEVNPKNIVDTAGAWDNQDFVSRVWEETLAPGFETQDGAVVLDPSSVKLLYDYDRETDYLLEGEVQLRVDGDIVSWTGTLMDQQKVVRARFKGRVPTSRLGQALPKQLKAELAKAHKAIEPKKVLRGRAEARHSRKRCMECEKAPEVEVIWADGRGRAWFCKRCLKRWRNEEERDIVKETAIDGEATADAIEEDDEATALETPKKYRNRTNRCPPGHRSNEKKTCVDMKERRKKRRWEQQQRARERREAGR